LVGFEFVAAARKRGYRRPMSKKERIVFNVLLGVCCFASLVTLIAAMDESDGTYATASALFLLTFFYGYFKLKKRS
jgi:hypothetical protein